MPQQLNLSRSSGPNLPKENSTQNWRQNLPASPASLPPHKNSDISLYGLDQPVNQDAKWQAQTLTLPAMYGSQA